MPTTTYFQTPTQLNSVLSFNSIINQYSIPWNYNPNTLGENAYAVTARPLYTMSGFWQEKFQSSTDQLWCTGYKFPDTGRTVLGIELELDIKRAARIEDLVVQLTLNGSLIGNNLASIINPVQADMYTAERANYPTPVPDYSIYGGSANMWGTALTSANIANSTFGVVISFQSNVIYPHKDLAYIHKARLRVTYA
jgi:hypothetical protein